MKTGIHMETPIFNYDFLLTRIKELLTKIVVNKEDVILFILTLLLLYAFLMLLYLWNQYAVLIDYEASNYLCIP